MMTTARKQLVSLDITPYYHCVSRCVRQCFLCGTDKQTQRSYEHRRDWIETKMKSLAQMYCIDICAYAVMSNHYHLVLHVDNDLAQSITAEEVVARWAQGHKLPSIIERMQARQLSSPAEFHACNGIIDEWRNRLSDLSWFMRELNFDIACKANQEDSCKGHFWESRFKSQALLDEQALLAAMAYVDLNPIRAGIAKTPETSDFTSIKARLTALNSNQETAPCLHPFIGNATNEMLTGIPFRLVDYIELVDWSARQFRTNKQSMSSGLPPILQRLSINQTKWLKVCSNLEQKRATVIGCEQSIKQANTHRQRAGAYQLDG
jgi:REP element-mobilizing transposase RayT